MDLKRLYTENGGMNWHALADTLAELDRILMKTGKYEQGRLTRERLVQEMLLNYKELLEDMGKDKKSDKNKIIQFKKSKRAIPG